MALLPTDLRRSIAGLPPSSDGSVSVGDRKLIAWLPLSAIAYVDMSILYSEIYTLKTKIDQCLTYLMTLSGRD
jgi:hypothetical protein